MKRTRSLLTLLALATLTACSGATQEPDANTPTANNAAMADMAMGDQGGSGADMATMTPDQAIPASYRGLVINEVAAAGDPTDWVELLNTSEVAIDLTGCTVTDDLSMPTKGAIAAGTMIAPGEYLVLEISDETIGFKLGGDELVALHSPRGVLLDSADWEEGESPAGGSYGRLPDGRGELLTLSVATRGEANVSSSGNTTTPPGVVCADGKREGEEECDGSELGEATCEALGFVGGVLTCKADCTLDSSACEVAMADVVINEVTSSGDDQIELYNRGTAEAMLEGWFVADSNYPMDMESRYVFGTSVVLAPGAFLVLTKDVEHPFGIGKEDTITLYDAAGMVRDQVAIPMDAAATSYCRTEDGTGTFQSCAAATFGDTNSP